MANPPPVAVIDIGSNSIKLLVAARDANGRLSALRFLTIDARISAGIGQAEPRLAEASMVRGLEAIQALLADARPFSPACTVLVATSAVRDAQNGAEFRERVRSATGQTIRILTGNEEANLIGRGLTCDPALDGLNDFYVFDLGGGSLECLAFHGGQIQRVASLPLGCVRLMEKFVANPRRRFAAATQTAVARHVRKVFARAVFPFYLPLDAVAVGTGGTFTTVRNVLAARSGRTLEQVDSIITVTQLREMLAWLGALPLAERQKIAGLPPARADVFPTALATVIAIAEIGGLNAFQNSLYNLRWGLAAEALGR